MSQEKPKKIYQSQEGVVSIIVVTILTATLALIAIGFSKLSDRELRQASNRELSAQAYYAAQSGINDAIAYIQHNGQSFTGCVPPPYSGIGADPSLYFTKDLSNGRNIAKYSCIGVDSTPQTLSNTVTPGQPWVVKINAINLDKLYIGWENSTYTGSPTWLGPPVGTLPQDSFYSTYKDTTGVLRVGMYRVPRSGTSDNDTLASNSSTYYLYPSGGNGSANTIPYSAGDYSLTSGPSGHNGEFVDGRCHDPKKDPSGNGLADALTYCNAKTTGLHGDMYFYYLYFTAQYAPLKVVLQGTGLAPGPVAFTGAQSVIDVTGQAAGQIQRVRARVGLAPQSYTPSYGVQSMETLCKNFYLDVNPPSLGVLQYGSSSFKDTFDSTCTKPSGGGNISSPASDQYPSGH